MTAHDAEAAWDGTSRLLLRVEARRRVAEASGNDRAAARLSAMSAALRTEFVPLACPEAVTLVGDATDAMLLGRSEDEWYAGECARRLEMRCDPRRLAAAVRLLRSAGLWPWRQGPEAGPVNQAST